MIINRHSAWRRRICSAALIVAISMQFGCANMSTQEKAWQVLHAIDIAQTIDGPARDLCFREDTFPTEQLIGKKPSTEAVLVWGLATSVGHYYLDQWLQHTERVPDWVKNTFRTLDIGVKGMTISSNHERGIRLFRENNCPWRKT